MLKRKLVASGLTTIICSIIFTFLVIVFGFTTTFLDLLPNEETIWGYISWFAIITGFAYPFALFYGVLISFISEKIALNLTKKGSLTKYFFVFSAVLHLLFGCIFDLLVLDSLFSLSTIILALFFIIDLIISKQLKSIKWLYAILIAITPFILFILSIVLINISE